MPTVNAQAEAAAAALRQAVDLVERHAPAGLENDVREVVRRIGWMLAALDDTRMCSRCSQSFTFDAARYARERMPEPRTCPTCRRARGR
jgi:hypothetical protein